MNVNATCFVQFIHFFIAYGLFHGIFLRHAVRALRDLLAHKKSLENNKMSLAARLEDIRGQRKQYWVVFEAWKREHVPRVKDDISLIHITDLESSTTPLSVDQKQMLKRHAVHHMIERIGDLYHE